MLVIIICKMNEKKHACTKASMYIYIYMHSSYCIDETLQCMCTSEVFLGSGLGVVPDIDHVISCENVIGLHLLLTRHHSHDFFRAT